MNIVTEDLSLYQIAKRWLAGKVSTQGSTSFGFASGAPSRYGLMDRQGNPAEMLRGFRSLVFACIHVRANAVANAGQLGKFKVKLEQGNNNFIDVEYDHPLSALLRNPNPYMSRFEHWYLTQTYKDLMGNSYWWISRDRLGVPRELWTLPADRVRIIPGDVAKGEKIIKGYSVQWGYEYTQEIDERDIVHLKHPNPADPYYYGASRMMRAAREIDIEDFIAEHQREFFKNDATPASVVTFPSVLNPEARKAFEEQWGNKFKRRPGSTGFLEGGATITPLVSQKELDYINSSEQYRKKIQAVFGVPDSKLMMEEGILARATLETLDYNFLKETIEPELTISDEQLTLDLAKSEFDERLVIVHESVIPKDVKNELENDKLRIESGTISINEVRKKYGDTPVAGGDEILVDYNLVPLSLVGSETRLGGKELRVKN